MGSTRTESGRLLVIGDSTSRARVADALASLGPIEAADDVEAAVERLDEWGATFDGVAVVADDSGAVDACDRLRTRYPSMPIAVAAADGAGDETLAADAVAAGASAYVPAGADEAAVRERVAAAIPGAGEPRSGDEGSERAQDRPGGPPGDDADPPGDGADGDPPPAGPELHRELRDLRRSEELHRVVLSHMTDTVLLTDDDGEFTYVCPNVHFIFGYAAEEIYEMGTIDDLLGPDPIDREELAERGVLTNVECTATDASGEEHALLINARQVDIQGGTVLYSCRDVTARKRREVALTALHRTTRTLLTADSAPDVADLVVDEAAEVLDLEASAVFLFDETENALVPAAHSEPMVDRSGPPRTFRVNGDNTVGFSYLERESLFLAALDGATADDAGPTIACSADPVPDAVVDASLPANQAADVESAAYVPLGDHGVFVAGSESADRFDDVSRELAELLAAAAETALDRVARESALRERDRELKARNRHLARLDRVNEIIREIMGALVRADSRADIEQAVCERLTTDERFAFAWVGAPTPGADELERRAWAGNDRGYLDDVSTPVDAGEEAEPAARTAATDAVTVVSNVADRLREESWRKAALSRDFQSVISVPLAYDELSYGVLTVYADRPDAFDEVSRPVLAELGEKIASSMGALERKSALLTAERTRLTLSVDDDQFVLYRLARETDTRLTFDGGARHTEEGASVFVSVDGGSAEAVAAAARDLVAVETVQVLTADDDGGTLRVTFSQPFIALRLAEHGVVLRSAEADARGATLVVDVPGSVDARGSLDFLETALDSIDLVSKETVRDERARDLRSALHERLTDRQLEVAQVAYYGGYFEEPRERSGEAIAETLDISSAAFYRHARTVQRKLFETVFDGADLPASVDG